MGESEMMQGTGDAEKENEKKNRKRNKKRNEKQNEVQEEKREISVSLRKNEAYLRKRLENCSDILIRPMKLGEGHKVDCLMVYIEVAVSNMMLEDSAIGKMVNHFWEDSRDQIL